MLSLSNVKHYLHFIKNTLKKYILSVFYPFFRVSHIFSGGLVIIIRHNVNYKHENKQQVLLYLTKNEHKPDIFMINSSLTKQKFRTVLFQLTKC